MVREPNSPTICICCVFVLCMYARQCCIHCWFLFYFDALPLLTPVLSYCWCYLSGQPLFRWGLKTMPIRGDRIRPTKYKDTKTKFHFLEFALSLSRDRVLMMICCNGNSVEPLIRPEVCMLPDIYGNYRSRARCDVKGQITPGGTR